MTTGVPIVGRPLPATPVLSPQRPLESRSGSPPSLKTKGVGAVDRALTILDAFMQDGVRTLADIAKATGLAKPTVLRTLISLGGAGYVLRLSDGSYQLGAKTMQLGATYRANFRLDQHVPPVLERLSQDTLESSAFHVREEESRLCMFRVESPQAVRDVPRPTILVPLDETSTGHVLRNAASATADVGARARVYMSSGVFDALTASLSTAVFGLDRGLVGALTISGPVERIRTADIEALAATLARAAHALSHVLGAPVRPDPALPEIVHLHSSR